MNQSPEKHGGEENTLETRVAQAVERASELQEEMKSFYTDLHEHPELGGQETETSKKVISFLENLGVEVVGKGIGLNRKNEKGEIKSSGTGIVGIIRGNESGKTIAMRADMDALPIMEDEHNPILSKNKGVMHACGHDIHTSALLGATKILKEIADKGELDGNVVLLFQPSEEKTFQKESGAVQMVKFLEKQGLREKIDAFLGQHVYAELERGTINVREGIQSSSSGEIDIKLEGKGGHVMNLYEDEIPNLNYIFSEINIRLHDIFKPLYKENQSIVGNTNVDYSPKGYNVIPSKGESTFVVRISNENFKPIAKEVLEKIKTVVQEVVEEYAKDKVKVTITPRAGYRPIVHRDNSLVALTRKAGAEVIENPTFADKFMPGGEDFSFYLEELRGKEIPGVFVMVGGANSEKGIPKVAHHAKNFKVDPEVLQEMAGLHVSVVLNYLETKGQEHTS